MGYCSGYDAPGWANWGAGRRFYGRGGRWIRGNRWGRYGTPFTGAGGHRGGGYGWRNWYHATGLPRWARSPRFSGSYGPLDWAYDPTYGPRYEPPSREQEIEVLKDEAEWLKDQLEAINERMDDLGQE
jgi:hypothetical protein